MRGVKKILTDFCSIGSADLHIQSFGLDFGSWLRLSFEPGGSSRSIQLPKVGRKNPTEKLALFVWIFTDHKVMQKQTQPPLTLAPRFDLDGEVRAIMQLPCAEAMPRIWRLHRMLKSPANQLPPPKLIEPPSL